MDFRFIDSGFNEPFLNMAIDEALLTSKKPVVRFYRWRPSTLSIGYFQSIKEINLQRIKELHLGFVRRPTGGKAVFHDNELTYSFIINESKLPKDLTESYRIISNSILIGLKKIGLNAKMEKKIDRNAKSSVCFNQPSYYEITVNKKKLVGSAQTRKANKILQHGSILIDADIEKMCSLFKEYSQLLVNKTKKRVTSINTEISYKIDYDALSKLLKSGFEENFKARLVKSNLTKKEMGLADKLSIEKYSKKEWNYLR